MATVSEAKKKSFFQQHILPVLFIFFVPGFAVWFFSHAETRLDRVLLEKLEREITASTVIPENEKPRTLEFYRAVPVSRIMASNKPAAVRVQTAFASVKARYATFRWMKRIAWICLATLAATFLIVGISVASSFRSHAAQYYALRVGWPVLRTSAAIQVLGQGVLAVALSFWVTAIFMQFYSPKLIVVFACLALTAVAALWKAIFAKVDDRCEVIGNLLTEDEAPKLWTRVRETAARLETHVPDRIIVGVEPSFFVTEHPVVLNGGVHHGRSLYLSLPMLRVLAADEADAVLGHELAHFSGQDTLWSRKISPLRAKFALYMQLLAHGLSIVVAHFMLLFWKLYCLSISRLSRVREFRADQIGATCASKEAMKRALVKVTSYAEYRAEKESAILDKERVDDNLDLALTIEHGYPAFLSAFATSEKSINRRVPHPFDTHPTLNNRLAHLGFDPPEALADASIPKSANETWYAEIPNASTMEDRLWFQRQDHLQTVHGQSLAWRLLPKNHEEKKVVLQHFPRVVLRNKKGVEATLEFDRIQLPDQEAPILFKDIFHVSVEQGWPHKRLRIECKKADGSKVKVKPIKFYPGAFKADNEDLLTLFGRYFARHKTAEAQSQSVPNVGPTAIASV